MGRESKLKSIFFEGLFPHRNGLCPVLLLFSSCDCVILCAALWVCVCECVAVCKFVRICEKKKKLKAIAGTISPPKTYQRLDPIVLWFFFFFLVFGSWWRGVWSPLSLFLLYPPCRMKIVNNFSFSIVLFASVLLFMSHPNYLQLFPIATWLDFFLIIISLEGASLSFLNQSCRFTHLNGTVVFFCLFLSVFFRLSEYTRVKEEVQKDICSRGWTRNRLVRNL